MSNIGENFFSKKRKNVFGKIYIANVRNRLRELVNPNDADCKRWIWELVQNAKDSISGQPNRRVDIEINVNSDIYIFKHNGSPFKEDTLFGLLYKFSEGKTNNYESTGRFGTGFLTTHALSKTVEISGDLIPDDQTEPIGFSVTMYREGEDKELLEGLEKTENSLRYFDKPLNWTTYTYKAVTERNREAGDLGIQNFKDNIDKVMLFCPEINSIKLVDNDNTITIERGRDIYFHEYNCYKINFIVNDGCKRIKKTFLYSKIDEYDEKLTERFGTDRNIRICCAMELDENNDIYINNSSPSLFCSLPLVGSEVHELPFIINSPDFEPDSERQSIFLAGTETDEKTGKISDPGINRRILTKSHEIYKNLLKFICNNNIGKRYMAARGLRCVPNVTRFFDRTWYKKSFINPLRNILLSFPIVRNNENQYKIISELNIPDYSNEVNKEQAYLFISQVYKNAVPSYEESINIERYLWKDDDIINFVDIKECVELINDYRDITTFEKNINEDVWNWLNSFLPFIKSYHPEYLEDYAIIPNMNLEFVKLNKSLATSLNVPENIIECLESLNIEWKKIHIHKKITRYSSGTDHKISIAESKIRDKLTTKWSEKMLTLIQYIPYDCIDENFIQKRKTVYELCSVMWNLSGMKNGSGFSKNLWNGIDEMVFDKLLLVIQEFKEIKDKISIEFINKVLVCFSNYFPNTIISNYSINPNQNQELRSTKNLYKDINIPEIFKDCLKNCFGEDIRKELINKEININNIHTTEKKEINDYKDILNKYFSMAENPTYNRYSRTFSDYIPLQSKIEAAKCLIRIVPSDSKSLQRKLFNLYQKFSKQTFSKNEYCEIDIKDYNYKLWDNSNKYIFDIIREIIEKNKDVKSLANDLRKSEKDTLKYLNIFINKFSDKGRIVPNQYCQFCEIKKLMNEGDDSDLNSDNDTVFENDTISDYDTDSDDSYNKKIKIIPEELKDIAKYLGYDIKSILIHKDMGRPCQRSMSYEKLCEKIDKIMQEKHNDKSTYTDPDFKKGAYELIEKYFKTKSEDELTNSFKYTYSVKNNIMIDVVLDEEARKTLVNIRNKYNDDEIKHLLNHSSEIKEFLKKSLSKNSTQSIVIGRSNNNIRISYNGYYNSYNNNTTIDDIYNIIYKLLLNSNKFRDVSMKNSIYGGIKIVTFNGYEFIIEVRK